MFAPRDVLMLKLLGLAAGTLFALYLALVFWLSQTNFMSEGEGFGAVVGIDNRTPLELKLEALVDGDEWIPVSSGIRPNFTDSFPAGGWYGEGDRVGRDGCTYVPLRALDPAGGVVARHPPPLCDGETWVIQPSN